MKKHLSRKAKLWQTKLNTEYLKYINNQKKMFPNNERFTSFKDWVYLTYLRKNYNCLETKPLWVRLAEEDENDAVLYAMRILERKINGGILIRVYEYCGYIIASFMAKKNGKYKDFFSFNVSTCNPTKKYKDAEWFNYMDYYNIIMESVRTSKKNTISKLAPPRYKVEKYTEEEYCEGLDGGIIA